MKLVIFDLDDTLVSYTESHTLALDKTFMYICETYSHINLNDLRTTFLNERKKAHDTFTSFVRHDKLVQLKWTLQKFGITNPLDFYTVYHNEYLKNIEWRKGAKELFEEFDVPKVIMSNNNLQLQLEVCKKLNIDVDYIFTSNEFVHEKPHPESLQYILSLYNVEPHEAYVIGDSLSLIHI